LDIVFPSLALARNILGSNVTLPLFLTTASSFFLDKSAPRDCHAREIEGAARVAILARSLSRRHHVSQMNANANSRSIRPVIIT
jgi:hypothetical protein